jgi:homoserine dehydrogenase
MKRKSQISVLKFGSSVLRSENDLPTVVHEIYRASREGQQVIAVVSAFGKTTDQLMRRAETICSEPDRSALAMLLATGETTSAALLGLALNRAGIPARVLDPEQAGLRTVGGRLDADPIAVDSVRLLSESERGVVVLPGFVGRGESGDTTLLGRGGSDLTALFLAHRLSARAVLVKDVDGLYTSDPACSSVRAARFAQVSYETAARLGGSVVQPKAVRFASTHKLRFAITSIGAASVTEVGPFSDWLESSSTSLEPLRVALLGCGTVGGGVYERLSVLSDLFTVTGVGTRTGMNARTAEVPSHLITLDLETLIDKPCDVIIELIGGTKRASSLTRQALRLGRDVVTANKALLAADGEMLATLAAENGATLNYSAAVGGSLPALEAIKRARAFGPLRGFSGVLNGTCNFVLDRIADGESFSAAVCAAQECGYAEAEPQVDLQGIDAAQKLVLLARSAFDVSLPLSSISCRGIEGLNSEALRRAREQRKSVRLLAECRRTANRLQASVAPVELPFSHPLALVNGVENRLLIEPEFGEPFVVSGKGAGRWPTTEAVMADLFDIYRRQQAEKLEKIEEREECVA